LSTVYSILATILAYLIGSLSFAVIVSRSMGLSDPRTYGSKNPGATNVLRSGSKKAAIATLIGDGATALTQIQMIGDDFAFDPGVGTCGKAGQGVPVGIGQPSLKIGGLTVGGTAV